MLMTGLEGVVVVVVVVDDDKGGWGVTSTLPQW